MIKQQVTAILNESDPARQRELSDELRSLLVKQMINTPSADRSGIAMEISEVKRAMAVIESVFTSSPRHS